MSRKVALLIGVSEYGEGIPSLSAPRNDVAAMERVLINPHLGGFDKVEPLINPDLVAMQKAVQQIFANCHKDDLVLLFFSGHGITDDYNRLYFATKGTSKDFYQATSVSASFIQDRSLESYAKRLTEWLLNELKELEDVLGLEDKDIAQIQQQILAEKEAEYQPQPEIQQPEQEEYHNKLQQYEQEFFKAVEQEYPLSE